MISQLGASIYNNHTVQDQSKIPTVVYQAHVLLMTKHDLWMWKIHSCDQNEVRVEKQATLLEPQQEGSLNSIK